EPEMNAVEEHSPADALPVVAIRPIRLRNERHLRVVDQILSDAGQVGDAGDSMLPQLIGRADAGQHEELRRDERAGCDDDLAIRIDLVIHALGVPIGDPYGATVLDLDPAHTR